MSQFDSQILLDCNCMACVRSVIVSSPYYPNGWPIYQYGKSNTFEIDVNDNYICVDTVEIILSYSQGKLSTDYII